jgi:uncharacterized protein (DUF305 family)
MKEMKTIRLASLTTICLFTITAWAQHEGHNMGGMPKDAKMAPQSQQPMMQGMMQDVQELRSLKGEERERTYLTKMMDHHQSGIDMAKMALAKSKNPKILAESKKIIADQTKEIGEMRQHLSAKHNITRAAKPDPRMQPMMQKLMALSGAEFDRSFASDMGMHHQGAIDMSQVVTTGGVPHKEVQSLAAKIIKGNRRSQKSLKQAVS